MNPTAKPNTSDTPRGSGANASRFKALPAGWVFAPLSRVAELCLEKIDPRDDPSAKYIGLEHIEGGGTRRLLSHGLARDVKSAKSVFQQGDILFGKLRPYLRKVFCANFAGICSTDILVLRPSGAMVPALLARFLASPEIANFSASVSRGLSLPRIKWTQIEAYELPIPPHAEQRRIVERLETLEAQSQRARDHLADVPTRLSRTRQSLLTNAFSGKLTAGWRRSRKPNWQMLSIREVIADLQQGSSPRCDNSPALPGKWGVIKTTAVQPMVFDGSENKALPSHLRPNPSLEIKRGDVLITRKGPRARAGVTAFVSHTQGKLMVCDTVYRLRVKPPICDARFLAYLLNAPSTLEEIDKLKSGHSEAGVGFTQSHFLALVVAIPPLPEQCEIVRRLDTTLPRIDAAAAAHSAAIGDLDRFQQAILARAFRGQLAGQDPADESAETLLIRLAADAAAKPVEPRKRMPHKAKRTTTRKIRPILEVLLAKKAGISPEQLFRESGHEETNLEQVEEFYAELRQLVNIGKVEQKRLDGSTIILRAGS